jgi:hypothetical protein
MLRTGDRVRVQQRGEDGIPVYRYGYLDRLDAARTTAIVFLDDDIRATRVPVSDVSTIGITTVELCVDTVDLFRQLAHESALRERLVARWRDEAERAGLAIEGLVALAEGVHADFDTWALAELHAGGKRFLLRARFGCEPRRLIHVHALPHYGDN